MSGQPRAGGLATRPPLRPPSINVELSAASVDSQFPVDPHAARGATGDAGRLATLVRLLPIGAAADVDHQWHTKLGDAGHPQRELGFEAVEMIHSSFQHQLVVDLQH